MFSFNTLQFPPSSALVLHLSLSLSRFLFMLFSHFILYLPHMRLQIGKDVHFQDMFANFFTYHSLQLLTNLSPASH